MVYLELQGGKERGLDLAPARRASRHRFGIDLDQWRLWRAGPGRLRPVPPKRNGALHAEFIAKTLKDKAVWLTYAEA